MLSHNRSNKATIRIMMTIPHFPLMSRSPTGKTSVQIWTWKSSQQSWKQMKISPSSNTIKQNWSTSRQWSPNYCTLLRQRIVTCLRNLTRCSRRLMTKPSNWPTSRTRLIFLTQSFKCWLKRKSSAKTSQICQFTNMPSSWPTMATLAPCPLCIRISTDRSPSLSSSSRWHRWCSRWTLTELPVPNPLMDQLPSRIFSRCILHPCRACQTKWCSLTKWLPLLNNRCSEPSRTLSRLIPNSSLCQTSFSKIIWHRPLRLSAPINSTKRRSNDFFK